MTPTEVIASQSIGTGANVGPNLFPQKVAAAVTTTAFLLTIHITNGAGGYDPKQAVTVHFASSPYSAGLTAAQGMAQLRDEAYTVDIRPRSGGGDITIRNTPSRALMGGYIYFWFTIPAVSVAQTMAVTLVETP